MEKTPVYNQSRWEKFVSKAIIPVLSTILAVEVAVLASFSYRPQSAMRDSNGQKIPLVGYVINYVNVKTGGEDRIKAENTAGLVMSIAPVLKAKAEAKAIATADSIKKAMAIKNMAKGKKAVAPVKKNFQQRRTN